MGRTPVTRPRVRHNICQSSNWQISFLVRWLFWAALLVPLGYAPVNAEQTADDHRARLLREVERQGLAGDPTWRQLLQFAGEPGRSRITSPEFFLAQDGRESADSELRATINGYFAPAADNQDLHPRCRYPARYFWLANRLGPDSGIEPAADCPRLEHWAKFADLKSISLVMISGYFGNPASSFGHIILKLNNGDSGSGLTLLDLGINYGAMVPENEWTPIYVMRGLFGGYEAGFSDKLYYTQDLAYTQLGFRDMWEYELDLPAYETRLIVYHLWEVVGRKFQYLFLKENCAFRLAQLLELATGEDFTSDVDVWYAPVSVFHRLKEVDRGPSGPVIRAIRFVPSSQRVLYEEFARLNEDEKQAANALIRNPEKLDVGMLGQFSSDRLSVLMDVLLAYYQYRLVSAQADENSIVEAGLRREKDEVLRARLALHPRKADERLSITPITPPADGSAPSRLGLGAGFNSEFGGYLWLTYTAFHYDVIGNNNLAGSELVVFDLAAGYSREKGLFLDQLDFVRAQKANLNTARIEGESRLSWQVSTGLKRDSRRCADCLELYGSAGIGRARPLGASVMGYAMLDASVETDRSHLVLRPNLGLRLDPGGRWVSRAEVAYERGLDGDQSWITIRLESRYSTSVNNELRFGLGATGSYGSACVPLPLLVKEHYSGLRIAFHLPIGAGPQIVT